VNREIIRVEPMSTHLVNWKAPTSAVAPAGDTIYDFGFPPFDPETGPEVDPPIEREVDLIMEHLKLCLEAAGTRFSNATCTARRSSCSRRSAPTMPVTFRAFRQRASSSTCLRGCVVSTSRSIALPPCNRIVRAT
jgi:enamine deaminase RidA (YjgF/YER057c/UK114 family)